MWHDGDWPVDSWMLSAPIFAKWYRKCWLQVLRRYLHCIHLFHFISNRLANCFQFHFTASRNISSLSTILALGALSMVFSTIFLNLSTTENTSMFGRYSSLPVVAICRVQFSSSNPVALVCLRFVHSPLVISLSHLIAFFLFHENSPLWSFSVFYRLWIFIIYLLFVKKKVSGEILVVSHSTPFLYSFDVSFPFWSILFFQKCICLKGVLLSFVRHGCSHFSIVALKLISCSMVLRSQFIVQAL